MTRLQFLRYAKRVLLSLKDKVHILNLVLHKSKHLFNEIQL